MTLLVSAGGLAVALACGMFLREVGDASAARAHAQMAADASALAAIAESAPFGSLDPQEQAHAYAQVNGATLQACRCEPGATAVQVEVSVDGIVAKARAVLDPRAFLPANLPLNQASRSGLDPRLGAAVGSLIAASGGRVQMTSGYRSPVEQAALWEAAVSQHGDPEEADDWVARPGTSSHELGLAVDLAGNLKTALHLIRRLNLPLHRPLPYEPWHFELRGA
jgi:D-alanyl-D-alanine carboxypeptidase